MQGTIASAVSPAENQNGSSLSALLLLGFHPRRGFSGFVVRLGPSVVGPIRPCFAIPISEHRLVLRIRVPVGRRRGTRPCLRKRTVVRSPLPGLAEIPSGGL